MVDARSVRAVASRFLRDYALERLVYTGTVTDNKDPLGLGRVRVSLPCFPTALELPWLRSLHAAATSGAGHLFTPEVGDEVAVLAGAGLEDHNAMFVLGALYNGKRKPPVQDSSGKNDRKVIRTRSGNELAFSDTAGRESIRLQTPSTDVSIALDDQGAEITVRGRGSVNIRSDGRVIVHAPSIQLDGKVELG